MSLDHASVVVFDIIDVAVITVAVVRVARLHPDRPNHRAWSKSAWILLAVLVGCPIGPVIVPVGALLAIARTRRHGRRPGAAPRRRRPATEAM